MAPKMSAFEITDKLIEAIQSNKYDAIICNYANADMVGHTGDFQATIKAIETIDICLGKVIEAGKEINTQILITSDHGNAEQMKAYATEKIKSDQHTAHTTNLVPLVYIGRDAEIISGLSGSLSDIAPTMLYLMGLEVPQEMTGKPLLKLQ
jgi:2,3-bisphosphoglycerate-independent phosphoglycerate mutase